MVFQLSDEILDTCFDFLLTKILYSTSDTTLTLHDFLRKGAIWEDKSQHP